MRVGIYNTYMNTMGGGEKHMGAIAEYLSHQPGVTVDILTEGKTNLQHVSEKLHVDLLACNVIGLEKLGISVEEASSQYDLFINSTHWSHIKPRAKKNATLIFFPRRPRARMLARSASFKKLLTYFDGCDSVELRSGVYSTEKVGSRFNRVFGQWTKKSFTFGVDAKKNELYIDVIIRTRPLGESNLKGVVTHVTAQDGQEMPFTIKRNSIHIRTRQKEQYAQFTVHLKHTFRPSGQDTRDLGIFVTRIQLLPRWYQVRKRMLSAVAFFLSPIRYYNYLEYYDLVMTNSAYTQSWLKKMWNTESDIIYPIIETNTFENGGEKKHILLSVGRFFEGGHNKKHLTMIRAFQELYLEGKAGDWEYYICGGTHAEKEHQQYLHQVQYEALGYPITICPDIPFSKLKNVYADAAIFWHASGFGENENKNPDRFEHFGMTTVEAMSAGCIPVVIGKAGQKEIVQDGKNGFLWDTIEELKEKTVAVMQMSEAKQNTMSKTAIDSAKQFNTEACHLRLDTVLKPFLK